MARKTLRERVGVEPTDDLPAFGWPGGTPIYYLDRDNCTLCAKCATEGLNDPDELTGFKPVDFGLHEEGGPIFCDECNAKIDSAYGDPELAKEHETGAHKDDPAQYAHWGCPDCHPEEVKQDG